jgi:hypothetical protein
MQMTDEERRARFEEVFEQSRKLLDPDRAAELRKEIHYSARDPHIGETDVLAEWNSKQPKPEPERKTAWDEIVAEQQRRAANVQSWEEWLSQRLAQERDFVLDAVGQSLGEFTAEQIKIARTEMRNELLELQIQLTKAQAEICNLRVLLATNGKDAGVVDLPAWPKRDPKVVN